jgi:hypothetical protein
MLDLDCIESEMKGRIMIGKHTHTHTNIAESIVKCETKILLMNEIGKDCKMQSNTN